MIFEYFKRREGEYDRGFTFIEIMVVIIVIVILFTIGAVEFSSAQMQGRDVKRISDISLIQKLIENDGAFRVQEMYSVAVPVEVANIEPPRPSNENYCYYRRGDGLGYYIVASGMEVVERAEGGDQTNGIGVALGASSATEYEEGISIGGGLACLGDAELLDCAPAPDTIYCVSGVKNN